MSLKILIVLVFSLIVSSVIQAEDIKPFKSDGCSSFPNGTFEQNELWLKCCTAHDYDYWKGGTYTERLESDKALKACAEAENSKSVRTLTKKLNLVLYVYFFIT
jgi:hypothetical protein